MCQDLPLWTRGGDVHGKLQATEMTFDFQVHVTWDNGVDLK